MTSQTKAEETRDHMRSAAAALSEMLAYTVSEVRRLQKEKDETQEHGFESLEALSKHYDVKNMKELTAVLKDVAAVEKALSEHDAEKEASAATGVVFLPLVHEEGSNDGE